MGLIEELRKKFQKENADKFIKINIEISGDAKQLMQQINKLHEKEEAEVKKQIQKRDKNFRKRKGAKL